MEYFVGTALAMGVCTFALVSGFDRDRAFYATLLMPIATYYILFAVMAGSPRAIVMECVVASAFLLMAAIGFKSNLWIVAGGIAGHGVFDFFHHVLIENSGVPAWWPGFCLSFDILAGAWLAVLLAKRSQLQRPSRFTA